MVFYDITGLLNKRFNVLLSLLTSDGPKDILSNIYTVKDNKIQLEFSQFVNIETVDLNIVDFYLTRHI